MKYLSKIKEYLSNVADEDVSSLEVGTVILATRSLLSVLLPGRFESLQSIREGNIDDKIRHAVSLLQHEIDKTKQSFDTVKFLDSYGDIFDITKLDILAAMNNDPAAKSSIEVVMSYPGVFAVAAYRIAHALHKLGIRLIPRIITEWAHMETGIDIHFGAQIGSSFFIDHGSGVVIGETTVIGNNVTIYQGVTLGSKNFPLDEDGIVVKGLKRHPTIGNNVTIYANATILGGDTVISDDVTVAGNLFITKSVQENSIVLFKGIYPKK